MGLIGSSLLDERGDSKDETRCRPRLGDKLRERPVTTSYQECSQVENYCEDSARIINFAMQSVSLGEQAVCPRSVERGEDERLALPPPATHCCFLVEPHRWTTRIMLSVVH